MGKEFTLVAPNEIHLPPIKEIFDASHVRTNFARAALCRHADRGRRPGQLSV